MDIELIRSLLAEYRYPIIFPLAIIEGPLITMIAGFMVSLGFFKFMTTLITVWLADVVSDTFYYYLGEFGRDRIKKIRFLAGYEAHITKLERHFKEHPGKTLWFAKMSYGLSIASMIAAGASRIGYWKFIQHAASSGALRCLAFLSIGYYYGEAYARFGEYLEYYAIAGIILAAVVFLWVKKSRKIEEEL